MERWGGIRKNRRQSTWDYVWGGKERGNKGTPESNENKEGPKSYRLRKNNVQREGGKS